MIDTTLVFLRDELNKYLVGPGTNTTAEEMVVFPQVVPGDSIILPQECIVPLLVRIEEEKTVRFDERYIRVRGSENNPNYTSAPPAIPLHLHVYFISRFKDYANGLKHLSSVIRFFQSKPVLTPPDLPELVIELHTPTFTVQNEIWSALKAPQHPAVMYKITMLMLENEEITGDVIREVQTISAPISN